MEAKGSEPGRPSVNAMVWFKGWLRAPASVSTRLRASCPPDPTECYFLDWSWGTRKGGGSAMGSTGPASPCVVGITHPAPPGARGASGSLPPGWSVPGRGQEEDPARWAKGVARVALPGGLVTSPRWPLKLRVKWVAGPRACSDEVLPDLEPESLLSGCSTFKADPGACRVSPHPPH